jgi:hypothetical protein
MTANPDSGATRIGAEAATRSDGAHAGSGDSRRSAAPATRDERRDRIRWGAVWTGALTTLSTYVVLQLLFFALGWLDLGVDSDSGTTRAIVSGLLALVAFFLGGAAAGASALWHRANDGMVNAVVAWAVTVVALLAFALFGGGALLGALADVATQFGDLRNPAEGVDVARATQTARDSAGWAALGLGLSMAASALGGSIGAKLWPGRDHHASTGHHASTRH